MPLQWTNSPQFTAPSAADGVTVTPSGSSWVSSAWVELSPSITLASVLTGISLRTALSAVGAQFEIDIGTGPAASEVVIATYKGFHVQVTSSIGSHLYVRSVIPIDAIGAGARLSCRIRLSGTSVVVWQIKATLIAKPLVGTLLTTVTPAKVAPSAANMTAVTTSATPWLNSGWSTIIATTSADIVVVAVVMFQLTSTVDFEVDIGVGGAGSEVVRTTLRGRTASQVDSHWIIPLPNPLDNIATGVRVAGRGRSSGTSDDVRFGLIYHEKPL
jgi:hypothetical protein